MQHVAPITPQGRLACDFAAALVNGNYPAAYALLTPDCQQRFSPNALRTELYGMFDGYAEGKPERIWFEEAEHPPTASWPGKLHDEICWAYVGIEGDDFNEGVALLIVRVGDLLRIRDIEWGRP